MSGRNILLILIAVLAAIGVYYLLGAPSDHPPAPAVATPTPKPAAPAPVKDTAAPRSPTGEPAPTDLVAEDAAKMIEEIKKQQEQEMMERPAMPEMQMEKAN